MIRGEPPVVPLMAAPPLHLAELEPASEKMNHVFDGKTNYKPLLVGGAMTIFKNIQWEGWHPIYEMEHKIHVPNHQPVMIYHLCIYIYIYMKPYPVKIYFFLAGESHLLSIIII